MGGRQGVAGAGQAVGAVTLDELAALDEVVPPRSQGRRARTAGRRRRARPGRRTGSREVRRRGARAAPRRRPRRAATRAVRIPAPLHAGTAAPAGRTRRATDRLEIAGARERRQRRGPPPRVRCRAGHELAGREAGRTAVGRDHQAGSPHVAGRERPRERRAARRVRESAAARRRAHAAADGLAGRQRAQDEAVVRLDGGRAAVEPHDRHRRRPGASSRRSKKLRDARRCCAVPWCRRTRSPVLSGREPPTSRTPAVNERVGGMRAAAPAATRKTPRSRWRAVDAAQVEGHAAAGGRRLDGAVVHLHAAHRHRLAGGLHDQAVAGGHAAAPQRAGDHGADPLQGKDAVDRQAGRPLTRPATVAAAAPARASSSSGRPRPSRALTGDDGSRRVGRLGEEARRRRRGPARAARRRPGRPW